MTRIANEGRRTYRSELRDQQQAATRTRILDAAVRVMAQGLASMSIPAVAREAGVSVPTVYRHFRTKAELFAALYPHVLDRTGSGRMVLPNSLDEFGPGLAAHWGRLDALGEVERAAMDSPIAQEARRSNMPERIAMTHRLADAVVPAGSRVDHDRLARVLTVLTGTAAFRTWRDNLGCTPQQAADDVDWVVRQVIAAAEEGAA